MASLMPTTTTPIVAYHGKPVVRCVHSSSSCILPVNPLPPNPYSANVRRVSATLSTNSVGRLSKLEGRTSLAALLLAEVSNVDGGGWKSTGVEVTGGGVVVLKLDSSAGIGCEPAFTSLPSSPMIGAGELPLGQREKARV